MFEGMPGIEVVKAMGFYVPVSAARPLGFISFFTVISFGVPSSRMVKMALGLGFGLPVAVVYEVPLFDVYVDGLFFDRVFLTFKEMLLGVLIGLFASLPFYGFKSAGNLVDFYRGESNNGLTMEEGETTTTLGLLFYLVLLYEFLANDGFWRVIEVVYVSYVVWPIDLYLPTVETAAVGVVVEYILQVFYVMLQVGLPLFMILFLCEFFVVMSNSFGQRFGFGTSIALAKNLCCLVVLPVYFIYLSHASGVYVGDVWMPLHVIEKIIK
jgi:type III secretion protein T